MTDAISSREQGATQVNNDHCPSPVGGVPLVDPGLMGRWSVAVARYTAAVARLHALETTGEADCSAAIAEEAEAIRDLMLTPTPSFDWISTKFRIFHELFDGAGALFSDCRELLFLAALEADVRRLADLEVSAARTCTR